MHWRIGSGIGWIGSIMAALRPGSVSLDSSVSGFPNSFFGLLNKLPIFDSKKKLVRAGDNRLGLLPSVKRNPVSRLEASSDSVRLGQDLTNNNVENLEGLDIFGELKHREESEHFQALAKAQSPKFMVIACADSRVCPSNILGFQPGEAFMIRNVANLVPSIVNGASETNAALEFAVNTLEVENILVIGHSCCAGIETLMNMQDDEDSSSFVENWVANGKVAKLRTKAAAGHLSLDQQCKHCEKESINLSLLNLLTYPWIEDRVKKELLSIHGGYYDFLNCTFEKWTIDLKRSGIEKEGCRYLFKDQAFWC